MGTRPFLSNLISLIIDFINIHYTIQLNIYKDFFMARVTIEDCLERINNRFELSVAAMKRAKKIYEGEKSLSDEDNKPVVLALREIAEEKISSTQKKD
tara:strand:- start:20291 stop:20584 length:294 start_codon:yes stop_codon:yes gene_type:complete